MSTYLGKNASSGSSLIITNGTHTLAEMKDPILPADTVFASGLPFLTCEVFTSVTATVVNTSYYNLVAAEFSVSDAETIQNRMGVDTETRRVLICYTVNGVIVPGHLQVYNNSSFIWDWVTSASFPDGTNVRPYTRVPNATYRFKAIAWGGGTVAADAVKIYMFNVSADALALYQNSSMTGATEVLVKDNSLLVNGADLTGIKFVTVKPVTNADSFRTAADGGDVYVLNNNNLSTACEFDMTPERTFIKNENNELLFDSASGAIHVDAFTIPSLSVSGDNYLCDNITVALGQSVLLNSVFDMYNIWTSNSELANHSYFWTVSTTPLSLYTLSVTASGTTYRYDIVFDGVNKLEFTITLIYLGTDGNPGVPPSPDINGVITLNG